MKIFSNKIFYLLLFVPIFFYTNQSFSQDYKVNTIRLQTRLYLSPVLSFFKTDPDYSQQYLGYTSPRLGLGASIREEILFHPGLSASVGISYLHHNLYFESYYFEKGYSSIYDKRYNTYHIVKINELQLPLLLNFSFPVGGQVHPQLIYVDAGWVYRYFVSSSSNITLKDGKELWAGNTHLKMEYPLFNNKGGSMLQAGLGYEHDHRKNGKAIFFEINYKYGLSRFLYTGNGTSNDLLIGNSFFALVIGYKF